MERLYLSKDEFYSLDYLKLRVGTAHTESSFYVAPNGYDVLKYLLYFNKQYLEQKLNNIKYLNALNIEHNIDGLVIPKGELYIDNIFRGIVLPKVDGINASIYLNSNKCPLKIKIEILKKIGKLLEDIHIMASNYNMAFSDVHADNFMVDGVYKDHLDDLSTVKVFGIDTDSCKIMDSEGGINDYLHYNHWIQDIDKYEYNEYGMINTNYQTDIYCFVIMILKTLFEENLYKYNLDEFKCYIDYLSDLGLGNDLIVALASVYQKEDNINPLPYLDNLMIIEKHLESNKKLTLKR